MGNLTKSAIWYAAKRGWYVVPLHTPFFDADGHCIGCSCEEWKRQKFEPDYICPTPGKHPRLNDWEAKASNSPDEVAYWWRRFPDANVGIAAGKSGLLAFDIDSYKDSYQGASILTRQDQETVTNLTGSGGQHLIYRLPEGSTLGNGKAELPKGIDIRAHGGQFVAPPSVHPSGNRYRWELDYGPHEIDPLPLPTALAQMLAEYQRTQAHIAVEFGEIPMDAPDLSQWRLTQRIIDMIQTTPEHGKRSETDQSVITALVKAGATDDEIRAVFESYPVGTQGKYIEKAGNALRYLALSISRARVYYERKVTEEVEQRTNAFVMAVAI
jgi:hypothetical protein